MKIGDFSKLVGLPVKTVRYYSDIGLLKPDKIDETTNYREYRIEQVIEIGRILALKEAGFRLDEIKSLLKNPVTKEEFSGLLKAKLKIAEEERLLAENRIHKIKLRIKQLEFEEDYRNMTEISVKNIKPVWVASIREKGRTDDEFSHNFGIVSDDVKSHGIKEIGPWMFITHDYEGDWEACAQIEKGYNSDNPKIRVYQLTGVDKMACFIHKGPWGAAMKPSFDSFFEWCRLNGMTFAYPYRQIFHVGERENPDWSTFVTEIQYPLK
ncbi:MAG: MerR family transcriptional regulator [Eubacteriales bacterium]